VSQPLAHLYDLALRTLDDQERRADALRSRLGPVLAAAALGVTLLSGPLVGGAHPLTMLGKVALVVAVGGLLATTLGAFHLLSAHRHPVPGIDPQTLAAEFARDGLLDDETAFYLAMLVRLCECRNDGASASEQLTRAFTAMLWGILVMLCGLALAALVG
jgi:hypothetical protein